MKTFTAREAKNKLGEVFREAQSGPVLITMHGKPAVQIGAFRPGALDRHDHRVIDTIKQKISCEVLARYSVQEIKRTSISNIERWRAKGTFGQAYADWLEILLDADDSKLITAMVGNSDRSNQLRQSLPYTGMLDEDVVRKIREDV